MSIDELVRSYNRIGVGALADWRRDNAGAELLLNDFPLAQLLQALAGSALPPMSAPDGGLWHGRKVCDCLWDTFDIGVSRQQGWVYLKQIGFSRLCATS